MITPARLLHQDQVDSFFRMMLKSQLRAMTPRQRESFRAKLRGNRRTQWLYPAAYEALYRIQISKWQAEVVRPGTVGVRDNARRWIREANRVDASQQKPKQPSQLDLLLHPERWETFKDGKKESREDQPAWMDELDRLIAELEEIHADTFLGSGKTDVMMFLGNIALGVSGFNQKQSQKFIRALLGETFSIEEPWLQGAIDTWSANNYNLVKSLNAEYIGKLNTTVREGVSAGRTYNDLMTDVRKLGKTMTDSRARLIARDQVGKLNGQITKHRQADVGVETYWWSTSLDERVRARHKTMHGLLGRWDNPSRVSYTGGKTWTTRGTGQVHLHPGMDIQCRCSAIPNWDSTLHELSKELKAEEGLFG